MNYLASPPLCVAYALAGRMDIDLLEEPLGRATRLPARHLAHPGGGQRRDRARGRVGHVPQELRRGVRGRRELERARGARGRPLRLGRASPPTSSSRRTSRAWTPSRPRASSRSRARACSRCSATASPPTTSRPPGSIKEDSPAGRVPDRARRRAASDFNSYGSRRGNHEVMMRGTFANVRLRNLLAPGTEGGCTKKDGEDEPIFDAADGVRRRGRAALRARRQGVRLGRRRATGRPRGRACWACAS